MECSNALGLNDNKAFYTGVANGIMFVAAADPVSGTPISQNVLFGDSVVVDTDDGNAYSFGAITFQAGQGMNNGDKVYRFDGQEYAKFPAVLASNFLAPTSDNSVDAQLILFTLDGTTGAQAPRAMVSGLIYNDDEQFTDFQYVFDCFTIVPLANTDDGVPNSEPGLDQNFIYDPNSTLGLGSIVGHLELVAQPVASDNDVHDDQYGDGNDTRRRPVHGWIVQEIDGDGRFVPGDPTDWSLSTVYTGAGPISLSGGDVANWGRPLSQSTTAVVPFKADQHATLDADPRN